MTATTKPIRVDPEGERIYMYTPGETCVDICSGTKDDRKRAMGVLLEALRKAGVSVEDVK